MNDYLKAGNFLPPVGGAISTTQWWRKEPFIVSITIKTNLRGQLGYFLSFFLTAKPKYWIRTQDQVTQTWGQKIVIGISRHGPFLLWALPPQHPRGGYSLADAAPDPNPIHATCSVNLSVCYHWDVSVTVGQETCSLKGIHQNLFAWTFHKMNQHSFLQPFRSLLLSSVTVQYMW